MSCELRLSGKCGSASSNDFSSARRAIFHFAWMVLGIYSTQGDFPFGR